jgi:hypothetical protein
MRPLDRIEDGYYSLLRYPWTCFRRNRHVRL